MNTLSLYKLIIICQEIIKNVNVVRNLNNQLRQSFFRF